MKAETKEPQAAEVVQMLLDACKELLAESGRKRAADWEIINDGMVAGERFVKLNHPPQAIAWAVVKDGQIQHLDGGLAKRLAVFRTKEDAERDCDPKDEVVVPVEIRLAQKR